MEDGDSPVMARVWCCFSVGGFGRSFISREGDRLVKRKDSVKVELGLKIDNITDKSYSLYNFVKISLKIGQVAGTFLCVFTEGDIDGKELLTKTTKLA